MLSRASLSMVQGRQKYACVGIVDRVAGQQWNVDGLYLKLCLEELSHSWQLHAARLL